MKRNWSSFFLLLSLCLIVVSCTACGGFMALWSVGSAALGAVGVALASLSKVLSPTQVAAIESAVSKVQALWTDLKTAVTDYTSHAASGSLQAVEAVIADLQAALPDIEAAAHIGNPTVQAIIAAVLAAVGGVLNYLAQNVLPKTSAAMASYKAGDKAPAVDLDTQMELHAKAIRARLQDSVAASGADPEVVKAFNDHVNHALAHHIGPFRV